MVTSTLLMDPLDYWHMPFPRAQTMEETLISMMMKFGQMILKVAEFLRLFEMVIDGKFIPV